MRCNSCGVEIPGGYLYQCAQCVNNEILSRMSQRVDRNINKNSGGSGDSIVNLQFSSESFRAIFALVTLSIMILGTIFYPEVPIFALLKIFFLGMYYLTWVPLYAIFLFLSSLFGVAI